VAARRELLRARIRRLPLARESGQIAKRILWCAEDPKGEVTDRRFGRLLELAHTIAPPLWEAVTPRVFSRLALGGSERQASRATSSSPVPGLGREWPA
jgi:hypothetical protein